MRFSTSCLLALPLSAAALPAVAISNAAAASPALTSFADVSKQLAALTEATEAFKGGRTGKQTLAKLTTATIGALDTISYATYQINQGANIGLFEAPSYVTPVSDLVAQIKAWDDAVQDKAAAILKAGGLPTTYALVDRLYTETQALSEALTNKLPFGWSASASLLKGSALDGIKDTRAAVKELLPKGTQLNASLAYGPLSRGSAQPDFDEQPQYQQPQYQQPQYQQPTYEQPAFQPQPEYQQPSTYSPRPAKPVRPQKQTTRPAPSRGQQPAAAPAYRPQPYPQPQPQPEYDDEEAQYAPVAKPAPTPAAAPAAKPSGILSGLFASVGL